MWRGSKLGLLDARQEVVVDQVRRIDHRLRFRQEKQFPRDACFAFEEGFEQPLVPQFEKRVPQLPGEIDAPRFVALWSRETAIHIVPLDQDVVVGILLTRAELDVAPLQRDDLASPQTGTKSREEEREVFGAEF